MRSSGSSLEESSAPFPAQARLCPPSGRSRTSIAIATVAFVCLGQVKPAAAVDWYTGAVSPAQSENWIVAVDSSVTVTSTNSEFVDVGMTSAITGTLNKSGARVRIEGLAGQYIYNSTLDGSRIKGTQEEGTVLGGYETVGQNSRLAGYLGIDVRNNKLSAFDPGNSVVGTSVGLKSVLEFYLKTSTDSFVSAYAAYTTNQNAYFTRLKGGYALVDGIYFGPEVGFLGNDFFNQWRIGGHLTGARFGSLQLAIAAGYLYDRMQKSGAYTSVDMRVGF